MRKRIIGFALGAMLLALSFPCAAQQAGKIFRIGYLDNSTAAGSAVLVKAFLHELSKLGWIEGKNFTIEYRFSEQKPERLPEKRKGVKSFVASCWHLLEPSLTCLAPDEIQFVGQSTLS